MAKKLEFPMAVLSYATTLFISDGHDTSVDMEQSQRRREPFLAAFRQLSFVDRVDVAKARAPETGDLAVTISDRDGRHFRFRGEFKTSYLDRPSVHTMVANARQDQRDTGYPTLVFARYVPLPTAEQFLEAGVNFVDLAGNLHLVLGTRYERTIMGHVEPRRGAGCDGSF